jgi:hypothetical protein
MYADIRKSVKNPSAFKMLNNLLLSDEILHNYMKNIKIDIENKS